MAPDGLLLAVLHLTHGDGAGAVRHAVHRGGVGGAAHRDPDGAARPLPLVAVNAIHAIIPKTVEPEMYMIMAEKTM